MKNLTDLIAIMNERIADPWQDPGIFWEDRVEDRDIVKFVQYWKSQMSNPSADPVSFLYGLEVGCQLGEELAREKENV